MTARRVRNVLLLPEDLILLQTFDADLAGGFAHPHHARVGAFDPPLQQDDVAWPEVVSGGVKARSGGRNVESTDVSDTSGSEEIDFEGDGDGAPLFA